MKILKLIASTVLLGVLSVTSANAANVTFLNTLNTTPTSIHHPTSLSNVIATIENNGTDFVSINSTDSIFTPSHSYQFWVDTDTDYRFHLSGAAQLGVELRASFLSSDPTMPVPGAGGTLLMISQGSAVDFVTTSLIAGRMYTLEIMSTIPSLATPYNLTVTAVPLPAAFWLFGSALAGLGFITRKRTKAV